jgi:hypothetical protein
MLFSEWVFPTVLEETNCYLHQDMTAQNSSITSAMQHVKMENFMFLHP